MNKLPAALLILLVAGCQTPGKTTRYNEQQLDSLLALQQRADAAYLTEDWPLAVEHYQALLEHYPGHSNSWLRLANSHSELGNTDAAMHAYQQAIEHDRNNTKAWHNLGILQLRVATRTLVDMQQHAEAGDELAQRGKIIVRSIGQILQQTYDVPTQSDEVSE